MRRQEIADVVCAAVGAWLDVISNRRIVRIVERLMAEMADGG
jgi:hypothetical protein